MRNNSKGVDKLKLLEIKTYYVTEAELDAYVITFEFAGKEFIAIHVDEDSTNIVVCLERYGYLEKELTSQHILGQVLQVIYIISFMKK